MADIHDLDEERKKRTEELSLAEKYLKEHEAKAYIVDMRGIKDIHFDCFRSGSSGVPASQLNILVYDGTPSEENLHGLIRLTIEQWESLKKEIKSIE